MLALKIILFVFVVVYMALFMLTSSLAKKEGLLDQLPFRIVIIFLLVSPIMFLYLTIKDYYEPGYTVKKWQEIQKKK